MRLRLIGFILLAYFTLVAATQAAPPTPVIKIDTTGLTDGPAATVTNAGSVIGTFNAVAASGMGAPVVGTVAGKKAFTFNGSNGYKASFTAPAGVTGGNPWTVSTWIYNPSLSTDNDVYFQWARKKSSNESDGRVAQLMYQNSAWGAVPHNGIYDMGWGKLNAQPPAAGVWHNITVSYDGAPGTGSGTGTETIYVDGVIVNVHVGKPLNLFTGSQVLVGLEENSIPTVNDLVTGGKWDKSGLSGSIASLQMFDSALSYDDVLTVMGTSAFLNTGTVTDPILNNSFENYTFGGNTNDLSRDRTNTTGVYWCGFSWMGKDAGGTNNHYIRLAHGDTASANTSQFNNGATVDGYTVVSLETTAPYKAYLNQPVWGLKPNTDYKIWGYFNSRQRTGTTDNYAQLEIKMDGVDVLSPSPKRIDPVDATAGTHTNPFTRVEATWHSNAWPSHYLTFGHVGIATWNSINCDKICIAEVGGPAKPVFSTTALPVLTSLDFYGVQKGLTGTKTFKLVNDGGSDMQIKSVATIGSDAYNYSASADVNTVPAYGGSATITVTFSPTAAGTYNNAQLKIDTDAPAGAVYLPLTGYSSAQVGNGSFEQIKMNTGGGDWAPSFPGWSTNAGNGSIGFGVANSNNWKWDNGKIADGTQAATLNKDTKDNQEIRMTQTIPGFVKDHTYHFRFYANAWKGTTSNAYDSQTWSDFRINGTSVTGVKKTVAAGTVSTVNFPTTVTCVDPVGTLSTLYTKYEYDWTPTADGAYPVEFACIGNAGGDGHNSLLLDNVGVWDTSVAGPVTISATKLDFGNKAINTSNTLNLTISNGGYKQVLVNGAAVAGAQMSQFQVSSTVPTTVTALGSATVTVKYLNTSYGQKDSTLTLTTDSGATFNVALTANTASYPTVANGSVEDAVLNKPSADNNDNTPTGWVVPGSGKSGRSISGAMYNNNGIDPDGGAAIWLRKTATDTTKSLYQDITGFRAGRTYRVMLYANPSAANGTTLAVNGKAHLTVSVSTTAGANLVNAIDQTTISAVNTVGVYTTPWQQFTGDFTATADGTLRLYVRAGMSSYDNALLFDGVSVQEVAPLVKATPTSVRFATVNFYKNEKPTTATVTISNTGQLPLNLTGGATGTPGLAITGNRPAEFSILSTTPANVSTLAPGASMTVLLQFNPQIKMERYNISAILRVTSNDPNFGTLDIPLSGDGVPVEMSTFSAE